jgi:4-amino-4-deoxy-L-arabinose transferase-like glycosyltransferase
MIQSLVSSLMLSLLLLILIIIINLIFLNFREIKCLFSGIKKKTWIYLIIIFLAGGILRFGVAAHMHNLYYDENAYIDMAKSVSLHWNNCLCLYNLNGACNFCGFSFKSIGYTFILGLFFKFFGLSEAVSYFVSSLFGSLTIVGIFLLAYLLFKKQNIGLWISLILALYPLHIRWSGSAVPEIVALFFIILSFLLVQVYFEIPKFKYLLLAILMFIFTISLKEENILMLGFFILLLIIKRAPKKKIYSAVSIIALLIIPVVIGAIFLQFGGTIKESYAGSRYTFWKEGSILSAAFFIRNTVPNLFFYINTQFTSLVVIMFLFIGMGFMWKFNRGTCILLALWALLITAVFSAFLPDPLAFSDVRHYIMPILSVTIFAGYGLHYFSNISLVKKFRGGYIIAITLILSFLFYIPYITSTDSPVAYAQQDYEFILSHLNDVPQDCLIITPESYVLDYFNRNALSIYLLDRFNISSCSYYYESEICYRESAADCNLIHAKYNLSLIATNSRHSLYKIE